MCKIKHQQEQSTRKIFRACVPMKAVALAAIHILRDLPWLVQNETYISWNYPSSHKKPKKNEGTPITTNEGISYTTTHLKFNKAPEMETSQKGK